MSPLPCFIGWDAAQMTAWVVAERSLKTRASIATETHRLAMSQLQTAGLYRRPTELRAEGYWDVISGAPMATGHAIARFLVPHLCGRTGWALFTDGDVLFRADVADLLLEVPDRHGPDAKALYVVQHPPLLAEGSKMDGQVQQAYARKNWSSVILWNCGHPAHAGLTVDLVNTVPGRDLHRFCWLADHEIGVLPARWNVLVGIQDHPDPAIAHFTLGLPDVKGHADAPFADEWRAYAQSAGYRLEAAS